MRTIKNHRNDILLILAVLAAAAGIWGGLRLTRRTGGSVAVTVDGTQVARFRLDQDRVWTWEDGADKNTLVIAEGAVYMTEANCPDHVCILQGAIRNTGETIVCLPHKLVVTVMDGGDGGYDTVAR